MYTEIMEKNPHAFDSPNAPPLIVSLHDDNNHGMAAPVSLLKAIEDEATQEVGVEELIW
jgi:hypothetical protein